MLCTAEAKVIMKIIDKQSNKKTEIMNKFRHRNQFVIKNWKKKEEKTIRSQQKNVHVNVN